MVTTTDLPPLTETIAPADQAGVAEAVRAASDAREPVYPLGGQTSLDYGTAPKRPGRGLELAGVSKVVDYTPRDMTILVEAGIRVADLSATLAAERQHLPIDLPRAADATIGGAVATNWSGPRRYGYGTFRDYVIGIRAVDGRGVTFNGGGRVVKNVAGYDFCKLLTGSLGTLGVITQLAFKVKPMPETSATGFAECADLDVAEAILARLVDVPAPPVAIDLLVGSAWDASTGDSNATRPRPPITLVVRIEGTEPEVQALGEHVQYELWGGGGTEVHLLSSTEADTLLARQIEFADRGAGDADDDSPLVVKIAVSPSMVVASIAELLDADPGCTIQAHAASGIIVARFAQIESADLTRVLVGRLRPAAVARGGSLTVLSSNFDNLTPQIVWGGRVESSVLLERVKHQLDPHGILNPGRFMY